MSRRFSHVVVNRAVVTGLASIIGAAGFAGAASAQVVIGNWENLVTPPPPDPVPLPANFHRPIGASGTEGWLDWQNRGIYEQATFGATNGQFSLKMRNMDDGNGGWMQGLTLPLHSVGQVATFLTNPIFAIDVSWRESDWVGGEWSQVENLNINAPGTGFLGLGRATDDTSNDPPWNGSWDVNNFNDDTRTLTWDISAYVDGNTANGEINTVPAAAGGGWLELILSSNYDSLFNPATAAFYFDNVRLLPRVVNSEWKGGAPDPDNDAGNGNAATNFYYASQNWTAGVPGVRDATALFGTNGGVLTTPQTVNTDRLVTVGAMTFDNAAGYTLGGTGGSITMDVTTGNASINVVTGNHVVNLPITLADNTTVTVASGAGLSVKRFRGAGLTVSSGSTVRVSPDGTDEGTSNVTSVAVSAGGKLDITNNALVVDYTGATVINDIKGQIASAYNGGGVNAWTGSGITSSNANATGLGIGYAERSALASVPAIFGTVDADAVLARLTRYGDADLSGAVNLADFNALAGNFGQSNRLWHQGDFNYDNSVNLADFNLLAGNFGLSASANGPSAADWALLAAAVPEPGSLLLFGVPALAGMWRRRRRA